MGRWLCAILVASCALGPAEATAEQALATEAPYRARARLDFKIVIGPALRFSVEPGPIPANGDIVAAPDADPERVGFTVRVSGNAGDVLLAASPGAGSVRSVDPADAAPRFDVSRLAPRFRRLTDHVAHWWPESVPALRGSATGGPGRAVYTATMP